VNEGLLLKASKSKVNEKSELTVWWRINSNGDTDGSWMDEIGRRRREVGDNATFE